MQITRRFEIDAGHRIFGHEGKCKNLHGHRYGFEVTFTSSNGLDQLGRLLDFSVVKSLIGDWLEENWDHAFLIAHNDPMLPHLEAEGSKHYVFFKSQPTIEVLSHFLFIQANRLLAGGYMGLRCSKVIGYETPNCWAEAP